MIETALNNSFSFSYSSISFYESKVRFTCTFLRVKLKKVGQGEKVGQAGLLELSYYDIEPIPIQQIRIHLLA